MEKKKQITTTYIYILMLLSICLSGAYFEYISCIYVVILLCTNIYYVIKYRQIVYTKDYNFIAIAVFCVMYLVSALYAVDKGYALLGFFKFLPVILMYFLICDRKETRERIIELLPVTGAVITFLTLIMMCFSVFRPYVTVAGRLAGTFQYPNTYALFLLICVLVAIWQKDKLRYLYIAVNIIGIIATGCRSIFVIAVLIFAGIALAQKKYRKGIIIALLCTIAVLGAVMILFADIPFVERIKSISFSSSTLLGRLLYYKDAIPVILKHPFGLGYYGYFFIQGEIQTGVYSVVSVHNELLQIMLDIGIIPAVMFFAMIIRSIVVKESPVRNKVVLIAIILHSLFDYNFQFMAMLFVMLLFLDYRNVKRQNVSAVTYICSAIIGLITAAGAVVYGISMICYNTGHYEYAYTVGKFNTMALVRQLGITDDIEKEKDLAQSVIEKNKHMDMAYNAMARYYLTNNDVENFILYELKCIELAPYNHDYYVEFADYLLQSCDIYIKNSQADSAKICYAQLKSIPDKFTQLSDKTSSLAWKINDIPTFGMPVEYYSLMEQYEDRIRNMQ